MKEASAQRHREPEPAHPAPVRFRGPRGSPKALTRPGLIQAPSGSPATRLPGNCCRPRPHPCAPSSRGPRQPLRHEARGSRARDPPQRLPTPGASRGSGGFKFPPLWPALCPEPCGLGSGVPAAPGHPALAHLRAGKPRRHPGRQRSRAAETQAPRAAQGARPTSTKGGLPTHLSTGPAPRGAGAAGVDCSPAPRTQTPGRPQSQASQPAGPRSNAPQTQAPGSLRCRTGPGLPTSRPTTRPRMQADSWIPGSTSAQPGGSGGPRGLSNCGLYSTPWKPDSWPGAVLAKLDSYI